MTVETWLRDAVTDAERRGLPALKPLLETMAKAIALVRAGDYNDNAAAEPQKSAGRSTPID